jgi:hypothetical protein
MAGRRHLDTCPSKGVVKTKLGCCNTCRLDGGHTTEDDFHARHPCSKSQVACSPCNRIFSNSGHIAEHNKIVHTDEDLDYGCSTCYRGSGHPTFDELKASHLTREKNGRLTTTLRCDCGGWFSSRALLDRHCLATGHGCSLCFRVGHPDMESVKAQHGYLARSGCSVNGCGRTFSSFAYLKNHQRLIHGQVTSEQQEDEEIADL